jgi:hypothetical protein
MKYRTILSYLLKLRNASDINVEQYELVVSRFFPLRNAVFALLAKSLFTVLILAIILVTFQYVHLLDDESDIDFNTLFPIIASLFAPGIIEKYCFESIEDKLHRKENAIAKLLSKTTKLKEVVDIERADIEFYDCYGILKEWERTQDQVRFEKKYVFPCIRCERSPPRHANGMDIRKKPCQVFCEEICSCFTLKCVNNMNHENHCMCCYTLTENYLSAEYERIPDDGGYLGDDESTTDNDAEFSSELE